MSIDTLVNWGSSSCCTFPTKDFCLYRATSWVYSFPLGIDLTGYDFILTVKRNAYNKTATKTIAITSGLTVNGQNLGLSTIVNFPTGTYVYDLLGNSINTAQTTLFFTGKLRVRQNIGDIEGINSTIVDELGKPIVTG
jgi:hypothetical protein